MNRVFLSLCILISQFALAQDQKFNLKQSIETALKNNISVRQSHLNVRAAEINYKQSKQNLFPDLNAFVSQGINQGRSIDPFTNSYVNQNIGYSNYGVSTNVIFFNGMRLRNIIRQTGYAYDASNMELQQAKDELTLNVIITYLQVLNNEDLVEINKQQVIVAQKQVERLEVLNKEGAINPPLLFDLQGQLKDNELNVLSAQNTLESSKLFLAQLMNVPYSNTIQLERLGMEDAITQPAATVNDVYQKAMEQLAGVKASGLRTKSAEAGVKAAKSELFPVLSFNGNLNTNYSSIASRDVFLNSTDVTTTDYVIVNGNPVPVVSKQNNFASEKIGYGSQLNNNVFSNFGVTLNVPIFNSFQTRNRIKLAQMNLQNFVLLEENTITELRQQVEQAHMNMTNAWSRYKVLLEQVESFKNSFRAAEVRFNAGLGTSVDYLIAKNNLDRANQNLITAKYDYLLRKKLIDFYNGGLSW